MGTKTSSTIDNRRKKEWVTILLSNDTSGACLKKWNNHDTWSMIPAALPLEERNKQETLFLLCVHGVHDRLSASDMLALDSND